MRKEEKARSELVRGALRRYFEEQEGHLLLKRSGGCEIISSVQIGRRIGVSSRLVRRKTKKEG